MSQPGLRLSPSPWTCLMAGSRAAKRQSRSEQGFSADLLEMRMWVLMTLLAGVVRCCHQSDWFRVLTSRQRNAAGTTHCDYHLNQAAHKALISGYFPCVSATLFMTLSALGILNPLRYGVQPLHAAACRDTHQKWWCGGHKGISESAGTLSVWEMPHPCSSVHDEGPTGICSVFFSLIWGSKLLEAEDLTHVEYTCANTQYEIVAETHFLISFF